MSGKILQYVSGKNEKTYRSSYLCTSNIIDCPLSHSNRLPFKSYKVFLSTCTNKSQQFV